MSLYSVRFTTRQLVSVFDARGRKVEEKQIDHEQVVHGLPHATALSYKKFDNCRIEPYQGDPRESFKKADKGAYAGIPTGQTKPKTSKTAPSGKSKLHDAAASGDLAAAINGE